MYINKIIFPSFPLRHLGILLGCLLLLSACREEELPPVEPVATDPYAFVQPDNFPPATYTFDNNPMSKEGFELGKKIFFDPILSIDNTISCNSCHNQALAFADFPLHPVSVGVDGAMGTRNAPPLTNLAFRKEFFWDGGVTHLDFVPLNAIESEVEMKDSIAHVIDKLNAHPEYPALFEAAFGLEKINTPQLLHALSQFMNLMVSNNSNYDKSLSGNYELTALEREGLALFESNCATCHSGILFTSETYRNNGLDSIFIDVGRERISAYEGDRGKFLVPSLRNVAITAPYMHDARLASLEEVLEHYDSGMVDSETLDPIFRQADGSLGIPLEETEKTALLAFLKTLTDRDFTSDERFFRD